jgi:hypothetical protein
VVSSSQTTNIGFYRDDQVSIGDKSERKTPNLCSTNVKRTDTNTSDNNNEKKIVLLLILTRTTVAQPPPTGTTTTTRRRRVNSAKLYSDLPSAE